MKVKTSISLPAELIQVIDHFGKDYKNRSDFIETAVRSFIEQLARSQQNVHDTGIINRHAERLNAEAEDVLGYQGRL